VQTSTTNGPWLWSGGTVSGPVLGIYTNVSPVYNPSIAGVFTFQNTSTTAGLNTGVNDFTMYAGGLIPTRQTETLASPGGGTNVPYQIAVRHITPCNTVQSAAFPITVLPKGNFGFTFGALNDQIYVLNLSAFTASWFTGCGTGRVSRTLGVNTTATNTSLTLSTTAGSALFSVEVSSGGCVTTYCKQTVNYSNRSATGNTGIEKGNATDKQAPQFTVTPNPNNGTFRIEMLRTGKKGTMTLLDMTGKKLVEKPLQAGGNEFSFSLTPGVYQLHMTADGYEQTEKIVVKK
jgi:hypothetical protein